MKINLLIACISLCPLLILGQKNPVEIAPALVYLDSNIVKEDIYKSLKVFIAEDFEYSENVIKLDDWRDGGIREKKLMLAVKDLIKDQTKTDELMKIIKAQDEY